MAISYNDELGFSRERFFEFFVEFVMLFSISYLIRFSLVLNLLHFLHQSSMLCSVVFFKRESLRSPDFITKNGRKV